MTKIFSLKVRRFLKNIFTDNLIKTKKIRVNRIRQVRKFSSNFLYLNKKKIIIKNLIKFFSFCFLNIKYKDFLCLILMRTIVINYIMIFCLFVFFF